MCNACTSANMTDQAYRMDPDSLICTCNFCLAQQSGADFYGRFLQA